MVHSKLRPLIRQNTLMAFSGLLDAVLIGWSLKFTAYATLSGLR